MSNAQEIDTLIIKNSAIVQALAEFRQELFHAGFSIDEIKELVIIFYRFYLEQFK